MPKHSWGGTNKQAGQTLFVGRGDQLKVFAEEIASDEPKLQMLMIFGQGGVGKSTLLNKFTEIAQSRGILTPRTDHLQGSVLETLVSLGTQLETGGYPVKRFMGRYLRYQELQAQVAADPGAAKGVVDHLLSGVSLAGINNLKRPDVASPSGALSAEDVRRLADETSSFQAYVARKVPDQKDRELLLETEFELTEALINDLCDEEQTGRVIIFFDTYERTAPYLDSWLRDIILGRFHYRLSETLLQFVIAGRLPLGREWRQRLDYIRELELSPFTEQEARDYLAKQGMSDEEEIRQVNRLCQGLPVLLALQAASPGSSQGSVYASAVDRFLEGASEDQRRWARTSSVPRYFNLDVLSAILDADSAAEAFEWLSHQAFIGENDKGWHYHEVVRTLMYPYFQRMAVMQWAETHQRMEAYYQALMERTGGASRENSRTELLYHRLSRDFTGTLVAELRSFLQLGRVGVFEEPANDPNKAYFPLQAAAVQVGVESSDIEVQSWAARLKAFAAFESDAASSREFFTYLGGWEQLDLSSRVSALAILAVVEAMNDNDQAALLTANRAIRLGPEDAFAYQVRALLRISSGDPKAALPDLDRAIELMPENKQVYRFRGQVCYTLQDYPAALESLAKAIALNPADGNSYYWRGRVLVNQRQFPQALENFEHAVELQPEDGQVRLLAGMTRYMMRDYPGALADLNQAVRLIPESGDCYYWRGSAFFQQGQAEEALADLSRAVEIQPQDGNNYYWRARVLYSLGKFPEALGDLNQAITLQPEDAENYHLRGLVNNDQKSFPQAIADFTQAIRLAPQDAKNYSWRGMVYYTLRDFPTALADFEKALSIEPNDADAQFLRGNICYRLKDYEAARESFTRAVELRGDDADNHYWRALTHYELDNPFAALGDFSEAIQLKPTVSDFYYRRGLCYYQLQQYDNALADLQQAVQLQPDDPQYYLWSGMMRHLMDDFPGAIGDLSQALALDSQNCDAFYWRGTSSYHLGDYPAALADLDAAVQIAPEDSTYHYWRGRANYHLKHFQAALDDLAAAEKGMPGEASLPYYRGRAHFRLGNTQQALTELDQAVTLNPDDPQCFYWRAMVRESTGNLAGALEDLDRAIQIAPDLVVCYTARGQVYRDQGETQKALADFERATQLDQQEPYGFFLHGLACRELGDAAHALEDLNKVAELAPNQAEGYYWRAVIQEEAGEPAAALEDLSRALQLEPENGYYLLCRGLLSLRLARPGQPAPGGLPLPPPTGEQAARSSLPHEARLDLLKIKDLSGLPARTYLDAAAGLVQLQEYDEACRLLRLGLQSDASLTAEVVEEQTFEPLRGRPAYQELIKEFGG